MARTFSRKRPLQAVSEINVTPLLDLAFSLLIIFMIAAPLLEQSIEVQLPVETARPQTERDPDRIETITIDAEGQVFWGDDAVDAAALQQRLAEAAARPQAPIIAVRGDARVPYQAVIGVVDAIKAERLTRLMLDTRGE